MGTLCLLIIAPCKEQSIIYIYIYVSNYPYIYKRTHTHIYIHIYWWQSGSTERNPLCLVMIIPCISCIAPTMYTARFEPAEQVCAPHVLNIYIYIYLQKPHSVIYKYTPIYLYLSIYIYIELCKYKCVYSEMLTHTHTSINIYIYVYISPEKNVAKWLNREILS